MASVAYAAGLSWTVANLVAQVPRIALARAGDEAHPRTVAIVNDLGVALDTVANLPIVALVVAVGVLALRASALPRWLGWFSAVAAAVHLVASSAIVVDTGVVAPDGVVAAVTHPLLAVWLAAVLTVMISRRPGVRSAPAPSLAGAGSELARTTHASAARRPAVRRTGAPARRGRSPRR